MPSKKSANAPSGVVFTEEMVGWDFGPPYLAMVTMDDDDGWNGFTVPFFAKEEADKLAAYMNAEAPKGDGGATLVYDEAKRTYTLTTPFDTIGEVHGEVHAGEDVQVIEPMMFSDGVERWDFGFGWTWGVVAHDEPNADTVDAFVQELKLWNVEAAGPEPECPFQLYLDNKAALVFIRALKKARKAMKPITTKANIRKGAIALAAAYREDEGEMARPSSTRSSDAQIVLEAVEGR